MEQITNTDTLLRTAQEEQTALQAEPRPLDPADSWARLTEAQLDPVVLKRHHIQTTQPGPSAAPYDRLRTRLLSHMRAAGHRRVAITAPTQGCGSSTITANLALSLARQSDLRVMVLDFNLRNPKLIHIFGLSEAGPRFSVLTGQRRNFDSTCLRVDENLGLSLNATALDDAAERLAHGRTANLLDRIERDFAPDIMLFDLAALGPADDAIAALPLVDCALLVARADKSTTREIDDAEHMVAENTTCLGVVLNGCRFAGSDV
ncbi:CpsD/CapB family tyrosine-protein kinase [Litoreibacter arenae]|uniref:Exopolysaccharide biosynthesis domain protein n=1 Tax=Litoreibacter arenae DSM 19593 TaxID=1123360 RepID=S9Q839_9RHOB|nr:CpsD/CapB family tyrosine-protein kinase [Litoreibacter arenae]EPX77526.1 exopolysaccharide biosynthesis domain protein [Litoreibacter arenae DSM 19593]